MGTFNGHVLPGSMFIVIGFWWCVKCSYRLFNRHYQYCPVNLLRSVDFWEACVGLFLAVFGLVIEQVLPWEPYFNLLNDEGEFINGNNWQHSTMYACFVIAFAARISVIKFPKLSPHCIHHVTMAFAFFMEGYLFYFHTHGRADLDIRVHVLIVFATWSTAAVSLLLAFLDNNSTIAIGKLTKTEKSSKTEETHEMDTFIKHRSVKMNELQHQDNTQRKYIVHSVEILQAALTVCHGTWFIQVAYILYPPYGDKWDQEDHMNVGFATMFFVWHMILAILVCGIVYAMVGYKSTKKQLHNKRKSYMGME